MVSSAVVPISSELLAVPVRRVIRAPDVTLADLIVVVMLDEEIRRLREKLHAAERMRRQYPVSVLHVV